MKSTDTLSKVIMFYWIAILCMATFYSIESFADFLSGNEDFTYRIILRAVALIAILYVLVKLIMGLFRKVSNSLGILRIITRYSYLIGLLGLVAIVMHLSNLARSFDVYLFGGVCGFIAFSGYLSNWWFKRNYQTMQLEE